MIAVEPPARLDPATALRRRAAEKNCEVVAVSAQLRIGV